LSLLLARSYAPLALREQIKKRLTNSIRDGPSRQAPKLGRERFKECGGRAVRAAADWRCG
jgi:hypothetical protein